MAVFRDGHCWEWKENGEIMKEKASAKSSKPLKKPEDFNKFRNQLVKIKLYEPLEGRKNFKGTLLGLEDDKVRVEVDQQVFELPLKSIAKANLEIDF